MEIIHDWNDEESVRILQAVRNVAPAHAKLLLIENAIPTGDKQHRGQIVNIFMLSLLPGRQRTTEEYTRLFTEGEFCLSRVISATQDLSILRSDSGVVSWLGRVVT